MNESMIKMLGISLAVVIGLARPLFVFHGFNHHVEMTYQAVAHILVGVLLWMWWRQDNSWAGSTVLVLTIVEVVCALLTIAQKNGMIIMLLVAMCLVMSVGSSVAVAAIEQISIDADSEREAVAVEIQVYRFRKHLENSKQASLGGSIATVAPAGIEWHTALEPGRGALVLFTDGECEPCLRAAKLFGDEDIIRAFDQHYCVKWGPDEAKRYGISAIPVLMSLDENHEKVGATLCPTNKAELLSLLTP